MKIIDAFLTVFDFSKLLILSCQFIQYKKSNDTAYLINVL